MTSTGSSPRGSPGQPQPGLRLETAIRLGGVIFALVVAAATAAHVLSLERTIETEIEGRARTLSRILAKEVNRSLASIQSNVEQIEENLRESLQEGNPAASQVVLESATRANLLIRELALVASDGQVIASSRRRDKPIGVGGYDFFQQPRDTRLRLGLPSQGRTLSGEAHPGQGSTFARQGFVTLTRSLDSRSGSAQLVAVIGTDSLMNQLRFLAADDSEVLSLYRYDGQLLATSSPVVQSRSDPQPIFQRFIPERETGQFNDTLGDGSRWLAHFDTTADFPAVVEVRIARSILTDRRLRDLSVPVGVMAAILMAVWLYTRIALKAVARRHRSEELAATQERRLRNILDNAADGIITIDSRGIVRDFNQAAEHIFGVAPAEAIGQSLESLLPMPYAGNHQQHVLRYMAGGQSSVIGRGRVMKTQRRDGRPLEVHLAVSEVLDQGERLFTGIVRDITEARQAEERFRTLFQRSGEPHLLFDERGLVDCNDAALALLGTAERSQVLGLTLAKLTCEDPALGGKPLEDAIAGARRDGARRLEIRARRVDGGLAPVEMTITPIRLAGNEALLVAWHDIADRQRYEQELRRARDEAQSAVRAKASFLAMMSHELRTPMTGVIGMSELLGDTRLDDEQRRLVGVLQNSAHSLLTVVNDVLDFSKIEAGKLTLESIDFDPVGVMREVIDLLSSAASGRGNLLVHDAAGQHGLRVTGDPTRLRQILFNLVGNAIKFTERGRITVSIQARPAGDDALRLDFEVRDTGIGIPPEVLPTLFTPFQQADSSTTRRFGGTGLGLAICRHLVTAMHGEIGVTSVPGEGSCFAFSIELPRAAEAPARQAAAAADPALRTAKGLDILLAEDNPTNQLLLATRLRRAGHRVEVVENGAKAVERVTAHDFDIVLMDMQMPVLDGAGATRAIRAIPGEKGRVPVLALTADALPEFRSRYMDSGLNDYLTKPVDWAALEAALTRHARTPDSPAQALGAGAQAQAPRHGQTASAETTGSTAVRMTVPTRVPQPARVEPSIDPLAVVAEDTERVALMRDDLGEDTFSEILEIFWEKAHADLGDITRALGDGDHEAARSAAHSMKGALGGMGFEAAARIADRLQHGTPETAAAELAGLHAVVALIRERYGARTDQAAV